MWQEAWHHCHLQEISSTCTDSWNSRSKCNSLRYACRVHYACVCVYRNFHHFALLLHIAHKNSFRRCACLIIFHCCTRQSLAVSLLVIYIYRQGSHTYYVECMLKIFTMIGMCDMAKKPHLVIWVLWLDLFWDTKIFNVTRLPRYLWCYSDYVQDTTVCSSTHSVTPSTSPLHLVWRPNSYNRQRLHTPIWRHFQNHCERELITKY
jgi:hypothetical protein